MGKGSGRFGGTLSWHASDGKDSEHTDGKIAAEVVTQIAANKDRPFFLACGFFRPHTPYVAPKAYFAMYQPEKFALPVVPKDHRDTFPKPAFGSSKKEQDTMTDDQRRLALQAYHAATTFMDAQIGLVVAELEKQKLADKTIVVFISDHGYHLGEHGLWQKMSLFENSARVPMIVYDPRSKANGQTTARTVELIDLHPTLADLCGLDAPKELTGKSVRPLLNDPKQAWDKVAFTQVSRNGFMGYSLRSERYRYTEWDGGTKGVQLCDFTTDPHELTNLAADPKHADIVKEHKAKLAIAKGAK